jgi:uncharacterized protein (TIGR03086 family)
MTTSNDAVIVLNRALDQMGDVLASIHQGHLSAPTPCSDWDVGRLIAHVLATPGHFLEMSRGEQPDWSATPPLVEDEWAAEFRASADDLIHFWHQQGDGADAGQVDWQTAEMAVHTWDLVRATRMRIGLDAEVAERGLAFMSQGLTPENRGKVFGPAVEVPDDAPVYDRLAGFAGRDPAKATA